jgi:cbb3-type cytochrome oxidase subunit 3
LNRPVAGELKTMNAKDFVLVVFAVLTLIGFVWMYRAGGKNNQQ